jgi:hypothetical protein
MHAGRPAVERPADVAEAKSLTVHEVSCGSWHPNDQKFQRFQRFQILRMILPKGMVEGQLSPAAEASESSVAERHGRIEIDWPSMAARRLDWPCEVSLVPIDPLSMR